MMLTEFLVVQWNGRVPANSCVRKSLRCLPMALKAFLPHGPRPTAQEPRTEDHDPGLERRA